MGGVQVGGNRKKASSSSFEHPELTRKGSVIVINVISWIIAIA